MGRVKILLGISIIVLVRYVVMSYKKKCSGNSVLGTDDIIVLAIFDGVDLSVFDGIEMGFTDGNTLVADYGSVLG